MNARRQYEYFDHTADIGVRIFGATLEELFRNGAVALYDTLGKFAVKRGSVERVIEVSSDGTEELMVEWLSELLFHFDAHRELYRRFDFDRLDPGRLRAHVHGAAIDLSHSKPNCELKAVTHHQAKVEQLTDGRWQATIIFDV